MLVSTILMAMVVFASTNIDDIFLLSAFFAEPRFATRSVVIGQFCGIGVLTLASAAAALAALAIPDAWVALLGFFPLALGVRALWARWRTGSDGGISEPSGVDASRSQAFAVMGVTLANGGDNLGVYIPLFASNLHSIPIYVAVFAVMTAAWCAVGHALANHGVAGRHIRRYGHVALPFVLIALGLYILSGAIDLLG